MVLKMAAEGMRAPSPPLPPDPSSRTVPTVQTNQQPPPAGAQQTSPGTSSREPVQPGLKRVDSSRTPAQQQARQPIKDAVTDAFVHSPVTNRLNNLNQLDPEFIKQVTEQVIKTLQASGATPTASTQPEQVQFPPPPPPPPPPQQSQEPRSPTRTSVDFEPIRYTPPSPERNRDTRESGTTSPSPSDSGSNVSRESRDSVRSSESQRSNNTPRPFNSDATSKVPRESYSSRTRSGTGSREEKASTETGFDTTGRERTPYRRDSKESGYDGASRPQPRQTTSPPDTGETPLEKFWQPLFDNGNPTMRLSQFLRGLGLHLIDDYEPKGSLVVTPAKMLQFLTETRVEQEHYPWDIIFGGKLTTVSISMMFQKLLCQHHLIQDRYDRVPTVPGLTPLGFDSFMTCLIQAHPDAGYERLAKAVMNMPISNADNKSERFPKELSRRLLPSKPNIQAEQRLVSSLDHEPYVFSTLRGGSNMPPPPSMPPPNHMNNERERKPYSQSSQQSNAFDDEDLGSAPPVQLERERKPYTAREGAGKQYEDSRPPPSQYRQDGSQANGSRSSRTNSGLLPQAMYGSSGPSDPVNIPNRGPQRLSTGPVPPPMSNGNYSKSARRSPPPTRNPFARSEPDFVGSMPTSQYGSALHPTQSREQYNPVDIDEEASKRYRSRSRADRPGTLGSDDDRGYPIPGRSVPVGNGYEYGSGPPIGADPRSQPGSMQGSNMHPVGSFPARRPTMGPSGIGDDRRRSMYASGNVGLGGDGGTDGYGSFAGSVNGGAYPPPPPQQQPYGTPSQH